MSRSRLTVTALVSLLATALLSLAVSRGHSADGLEWHAVRVFERAPDVDHWGRFADFLGAPVIGAVACPSTRPYSGPSSASAPAPPHRCQRQGWTVQYGSHQMCTVVVSLLNGFQLVSQNVTAVLVYPTGVAEIALFELPKLGPPIALN